MDGYVPPVQLCGSFQPVLKVSFFVAAWFATLLVNGIDQACHGAHAFPAKIASSIDDRIHRAEQVIANMNRRLGVYADSQGVLICIGQCVHASDVLEDAIGFICFF